MNLSQKHKTAVLAVVLVIFGVLTYHNVEALQVSLLSPVQSQITPLGSLPKKTSSPTPSTAEASVKSPQSQARLLLIKEQRSTLKFLLQIYSKIQQVFSTTIHKPTVHTITPGTDYKF